MPSTSSLGSGVIRIYAMVKITTRASATFTQRIVGGALVPRLRCTIWLGMTSPSETSLARPGIRSHRLGVKGGSYRLDFGYFHTVDVIWGQSLEGCNSPSGKGPNDSVQNGAYGYNPTRQLLAGGITGGVARGEVSSGDV